MLSVVVILFFYSLIYFFVIRACVLLFVLAVGVLLVDLYFLSLDCQSFYAGAVFELEFRLLLLVVSGFPGLSSPSTCNWIAFRLFWAYLRCIVLLWFGFFAAVFRMWVFHLLFLDGVVLEGSYWVIPCSRSTKQAQGSFNAC